MDFVVLDMAQDEEIPLILGRPFLATEGAMIEVPHGTLTLKVQDKEVMFNVFNVEKQPKEKEVLVHAKNISDNHEGSFDDGTSYYASPQGPHGSLRSRIISEIVQLRTIN